MKTTIKIIAMGALMTCVACGAKKSAQSNMDESQQEMVANGEMESQMDSTNDSSAMESSDGSEQADGSSMTREAGSDTAMASGTMITPSKNMDYLDMYSKLEMTDSQIQQFEGALTDFHTQQQNTPSGEMMGSLSEERDRRLKEILSEEQYSAYESFKESN